MSTELEACLAILAPDRGAWCAAFRAVPLAGFDPVVAFERRELRDTYYDSADGRLANAGMALRRRAETRADQTRVLVTWKGPSRARGTSAVLREELEGEPTRERLKAIARELAEVGVRPEANAELEAWLASADLAPIQKRRTLRDAARLRRAGRDFAELAVDRVSYRIDGGRVLHAELELEACEGIAASELEACAETLRELHPRVLRPWPWSKTALGRALERLAEAGELSSLIEGEGLTPRGYDAVAALLRDD